MLTLYSRRLSSSVRFLSTNVETPRSLSLPSPPGNYPFVGHLPRLLRAGNSAQTWLDMHAEVGDIYEVNIMGTKMVITANPEHAKQVLMNQGKYPFRTVMKSWDTVFRDNGWPAGIPFARGEDWKRRRQVLGETLLMKRNAKEYVPLVVPSANRLVDCLQGYLVESRVKDASVGQLAGMFALEAVMKVVVGVDFPALAVPPPQDALDFQKAVEVMFRESSDLENMPFLIDWKTKRYRILKEAWEAMYAFPRRTLEPVLQHYQAHGEFPPEAQGTVLPKLVEQYESGILTMDEVIGIGVQSIAAAIDTTAMTTEYLCYNLATNLDVQDKLYAILAATVGVDGPLTCSVQDYEDQKYLNATLKESMRLTPTFGMHVRTLQQDAVLGEYVVPKGIMVMINYQAMTRNPELYPKPDLFLPERFLKDSAKSVDIAAAKDCPYHAEKETAIAMGQAVHNDPYAAIPFGHGARKCTGQAFAEMNIVLAAMAIVSKYRIEYDGPPLQTVEKSLLRPVEPLSPHFKFVPRN